MIDIDEIRKNVSSFNTRDDVSAVLKLIAPPGVSRDEKKRIISVLFVRKSIQGYSTADDIESYQEY